MKLLFRPTVSTFGMNISVIVGITEWMSFPVLIKSTGEEGVREVDFLSFLERIHPFLRLYHVLVMDNARIHQRPNNDDIGASIACKQG